jgi:hypothetical protein
VFSRARSKCSSRRTRPRGFQLGGKGAMLGVTTTSGARRAGPSGKIRTERRPDRGASKSFLMRE